jgi:2-iminobutanoate/2-iminopropanoate deaminase
MYPDNCPSTRITERSNPPLIQTRQVLNNLENILIDSGSSMGKVVKTTVYISDISLWGEVNAIYAERFGAHKPARAVVPTRELHFGCIIEIEAVAERA